MEKILQKANELGHLLGQHEIVQRYQQLAKRLEENEASRKLLEEFAEASQTRQLKLASGQPIEVQEKHALAELEEKIQADSLISEFMATQGYYMNLMAQVNDAIAKPTGEPPKDSPIIIPGEEQSGIIMP